MGNAKQTTVITSHSKFASWLYVSVLILAWFIFSFPFFIRGDVPFPTKYLVTTFAPWSTSFAMPVKSGSMPDVITQIYPWKNLTIESWKQGSIPLWNPYSFSGTMHAGNYQSAVFSPINLLYVVFSMPIAWSLSVLFQPLLAGIFMFLFLKSEKLTDVASLVGSLAFMFCGFMVVWMAYETLGYVALMLPLCLYAINIFYEKKIRWALSVLSLGIAVALLSGHFQIGIYVIGYCVIYAIHLSFVHHKKRNILLLLGCIGLGILVATPQLWETLRAYGQSVRSTSFGKGEIIPWQYLITFFAPDFFGHPVTRNDWFGHYAEWAGFIGVIPLILSICAMFLSKHAHKIFFTIIAIITLCLALPTPLTDLLYVLKIPVLSTSSASRIIMLTSFSLAVLAGYGFDFITECWSKKDRKTILKIVALLSIFLVAFWIFVKGLHPLDPEKLSIAVHNSILSSTILVAGMGIFLLGLFVPKKYVLICICGFVLLSGFDVVRFAIKWMPFEPVAYLYPSMPIIKELATHKDLGTGRVIGNFGNELSGIVHLQGIEGYDAVYKRRYGEFLSAVTDSHIQELSRSVALFNKHGINAEKAIQLLGVKYYLHKVSDGRFPWAYPFWEYPNYDSIWRDSTYELFRNTTAFPRAYLVSTYIVEKDSQKILTTLFSDSFDRRNSLILEKEPNIRPEPGSGEATIKEYRAEKVTIETETTSPKLLFLSDVYDDGWIAYVNGVPKPLYRANYTFRAVEVPKGRSTVMMVYRPVSMRVGLIISVFAIVAIAGIGLYKKKL